MEVKYDKIFITMETKSNSEVKVCKVAELPSGQAKTVQVNDKEIGVFNVNGKFYAIDNVCIHAGAPLSDGSVDTEKCQVTCSWHGWTYDLASGKCVSHPRQDVFAGSYTVKVENDEVFVEIK